MLKKRKLKYKFRKKCHGYNDDKKIKHENKWQKGLWNVTGYKNHDMKNKWLNMYRLLNVILGITKKLLFCDS